MMKTIKRIIKSPVFIVILFLLAAGLIIGGSVGGARAVLQNSETYQSQINLLDIGISLSGNAVNDNGELFTDLSSKDFVMGKYYDEHLGATNTGNIDEYIRIVITRYWEKDGEKDPSLDPEAIKLVVSDSNWVFDETYSSKERLIYYYTGVVAPGDSTSDILQKICIDSKIASTDEYRNARFVIEAEADGVQTHNAEHAIISAWGRNVTVSGGTLSLD